MFSDWIQNQQSLVLTRISHYRANATAPQSSTALRYVGTGAALAGCATLQGVNPASPAHRLDARTSTRSSFARHEFCEICGLRYDYVEHGNFYQ